MATSKQMGSGDSEESRQRQQGSETKTDTQRKAEADSVRREDGQQKPTQFSDWASI